MGQIEVLRREYHHQICTQLLRQNVDGRPNNADSGSESSIRIARGIIGNIGIDLGHDDLPPSVQTKGRLFEELTKNFLSKSFRRLNHLRPGDWVFTVGDRIGDFEQYQHLSDLSQLIHQHNELRTLFTDYIVKPDIVVSRNPIKDREINHNPNDLLLDPVEDDNTSTHTPLRYTNSQVDILHASVSCKWTIRSDRAQNARTEALNLIRNRKGRTPHIVVVVGEPLPSRIASLAYGTGDLDCIYHFALRELVAAAADFASETDILNTLVAGRRLRDISDLPFDLAI